MVDNLSYLSRMYRMQAFLKDEALNASDKSNMCVTFSTDISYREQERGEEDNIIPD